MKLLNIDMRLIEPGAFSSRFGENIVFNRRADITVYDQITDKIEGILTHYDTQSLGSEEEIIKVTYRWNSVACSRLSAQNCRHFGGPGQSRSDPE